MKKYFTCFLASILFTGSVPVANTSADSSEIMHSVVKFNSLFEPDSVEYFKDKNCIEVTTLEGVVKTGYILYADDSLMVIGPDNTVHDKAFLMKDAVWLYPNEIDKIVIKKTIRILKGMKNGFCWGSVFGFISYLAVSSDMEGLSPAYLLLFMGYAGTFGAIPGGLIGWLQGADERYDIQGIHANYTEVQPLIKKHAMYSAEEIPGQLVDLIMLKKKAYSAQIDLHVKKIKSTRLFSSRIHLTWGGGSAHLNAEKYFKNAFEAAGFVQSNSEPWSYSAPDPSEPYDGSADGSHIGVEYNMSRHFRLGAEIMRVDGYQVNGLDKNREEFHIGYSIRYAAYNLFFDYVPYSVLDSGFELSAGCGLCYNNIFTKFALVSFEQFYGIDEKLTSFSGTQENVGIHLRGCLDYYFFKNLSVQLRYSTLRMPDVQIVAVNYTIDQNRNIFIKKHSANFSSYNVSFGLRLHF